MAVVHETQAVSIQRRSHVESAKERATLALLMIDGHEVGLGAARDGRV